MSERLAAESLIKFAILTDPHNEIDITEFTSLEEETRISIVIEYMREKGYRPITAAEYLEEKAILRHNQNVGKNMVLWKSVVRPDTIIKEHSSKKLRQGVK